MRFSGTSILKLLFLKCKIIALLLYCKLNRNKEISKVQMTRTIISVRQHARSRPLTPYDPSCELLDLSLSFTFLCIFAETIIVDRELCG